MDGIECSTALRAVIPHPAIPQPEKPLPSLHFPQADPED